MLPIVSFVGKSGSGKTTVLEKVIQEFKRRDFRIAVIKHDAHSFEIDHPGKDTWRMTQAGSDVVLISSPQKLALIEKVAEERTLDELVAFVDGRVDIVLTEGYRSAHQLKVEISRSQVSGELLCAPDELLAVMSDQRFPMPVPQFDLNDAPGIVALIVQRMGLRETPQVQTST